VKEFVKALLRRSPYRVRRACDLNRFDAIDETLVGLRQRGFRPTCIVDGGAHLGHFARRAGALFPEAAIHMIEPQPACREALTRLSRARGYFFHEAALVSPAQDGKPIGLNITPGEATTGAHVATQRCETSLDVATTTLDALLPGLAGADERLFLKLDLQGYELEALAGGERTLGRTEAILTEVSFFAQSYEPPIAVLVDHLARRDFVLYDVAALSARARDGRARQGDFLFVRGTSPLLADAGWS